MVCVAFASIVLLVNALAVRCPCQVVSFQETLKCIAKVVVEIDVSIDHPKPVGYAHEWFAAILIQKIVRGKLHRNAAAVKATRSDGVARRGKDTGSADSVGVDVASPAEAKSAPHGNHVAFDRLQ